MNFEHMEDLLQHPDEFKDNILEQITKNISLDTGTKYSNYISSRRCSKHKSDSHRNGPAPIEESEHLRKSIAKATYGTLDSDLEDLDFEEIRKKNANVSNLYHRVRATRNEYGHNLASCRALIVYFSKLAKTKDDNEMIDLNFVASLLENGADINFPDKHGQTVLHEISRGWHPDVAKFAIEHGANINKGDSYGRTPLHLAAAVDYDDMVQFLVDNGADLGAVTNGENQTAMHYAAKNNATASLKVMLRMGGRINDRDYKRRTPLFVAAETARSEAARFLIEKGAPAGVYDSSGNPCLSLMIEKMPQIAIEAIEQFHSCDLAFRKHYYYLSFLENDPNYLIDYIPEKKSEQREQKERKKAEKKLNKQAGVKAKKKGKSHAKTPLEVIVQYNQLDLIMHPVFQRLLHVKWNLFGKWGSAKLLTLNLIYTLIWTVLGIMVPRGTASYYTPIKEKWWSMVMETIGVGLTVYFIFKEIYQLRNMEKSYNLWRQWRSRHMEKDLKYCHPRWPEENQYLTSELAQIKSYQRTYFRDPWNIFEWVTNLVVMVLVFTRILTVTSGDQTAKDVHIKFYAIGLIVIWLRFMRSCRVFRTLGPFIAILGSVIADTMKFAFLFFEFFIPYTVAFWILFGGPENGIKMGEHYINWEYFSDMAFSVFAMTIMGPFDFEGLVKVDRIMAQVLCGTYFALAGVVCMNLYIALLSDTFARVYAQAKANAVMQQALCIITIEGKLSKFYKSKYGHYMQRECSPQEVYSRDEEKDDRDDDDYKFDRVTRHIVNRINELDDNMSRDKKALLPSEHINTDVMSYYNDGRPPSRGGPDGSHGDRSLYLQRNTVMDVFIENQDKHNAAVRSDIDVLKYSMLKIEQMMLQHQRAPLLAQESFSSSSTNQQSIKSASGSNFDKAKELIKGCQPNTNVSGHPNLAAKISNPSPAFNSLVRKRNTSLENKAATSDMPTDYDRFTKKAAETWQKKTWQKQQSFDSDNSDSSSLFSMASRSEHTNQTKNKGSRASLNVLQDEIDRIENKKKLLLMQKQRVTDEDLSGKTNFQPQIYPNLQQNLRPTNLTSNSNQNTRYPTNQPNPYQQQQQQQQQQHDFRPGTDTQRKQQEQQQIKRQQQTQRYSKSDQELINTTLKAFKSPSKQHILDQRQTNSLGRQRSLTQDSCINLENNIYDKSVSLQTLDNDGIENSNESRRQRRRRRKKNLSSSENNINIENNIPLQNLQQSIQQYEKRVVPNGVTGPPSNDTQYNASAPPYYNKTRTSYDNSNEDRGYYGFEDPNDVYIHQQQTKPLLLYPPSVDPAYT